MLRLVPHLTPFLTTMVSCLKAPRDVNTSTVSRSGRTETAASRVIVSLKSVIAAIRSPIALVLRTAIKGPHDRDVDGDDDVVYHERGHLTVRDSRLSGAVHFPIPVSMKGTISS